MKLLGIRGSAPASLGILLLLVLPSQSHATFSGKNGKIAFTGTSGDVFTMNPNGSDITQLTFFSANGGGACCAEWSPDGRQLVFGAVPDPTSNSQLWLVNGDGSNQRMLLAEDSFSESFPSFSPDGSQVVFTRCTVPDNHCAVYRIAVNGSNMTALTQYDPNPDVNDFVPRYSPDGSAIAFLSTTRGGVIVAIYLMNADGSNIRQLTPSEIEGVNPDWSPDGTTIVFWNNFFAPVLSQISTIHPDGTGLTQLTNANNATDLQPSWSPQQNAIVFEQDNLSFTASQLVVITANGSGQNLGLKSSGSRNFFTTPKARFIGKKRAGKGREATILSSGFFPRWGPLPQ